MKLVKYQHPLNPDSQGYIICSNQEWLNFEETLRNIREGKDLLEMIDIQTLDKEDENCLTTLLGKYYGHLPFIELWEEVLNQQTNPELC